MSENTFVVSRRLVEKGMDKVAADAVAEEIVDFQDDSGVTKADLIEVKAELKADIGDVKTNVARIEEKLNVLIFLCGGVIFSGFGAAFASFLDL